ncbi:hypothetical protein PDESU_05565 [Pontiella desulfatans]|uniref:PA14 domain-containing protein n=1 Tax=Pontiella desulfatans TaxID=2750659 RepID=A0A6C2UC13_PONDE|nr:hypothetical protein [Pontiella desulfatans]VGO16971.1 hypothetical protein PDESU_05565 [Pontiella desulfatans]
MGNKGKPGYFGKHAKSSAALVSLAIHAVLLVVALSFVAVQVIVKDEQTFEAQKVKRPKMQLKKLTVPVNVKKKKVQKPKLRKTIVVKKEIKSMDIKMPEVSGVKGGMGYMDGGGGLGGLGFGLEIDLFGANKGTGNEFEGTFFDLKMDPDGKPAKMDENYYKEVLRNFDGSWNISRFEKKYFKAPKKKFATTFMLPKMKAEEAPKAYAVQDVVQPKQWVAYYKGVIAAPETGRYRFWGIADDVLMVRVKNRLVIDANWPSMGITGWTSNDDRDKKWKMSGQNVRIGDWFHLTKGKPTEMEVLVGERPGGFFFCHLLIEQDGVEYPKGEGGRPLLPIFKTQEIPEKLIPQMKIEPGTCTTDGPTFGVLK